MAVVVVDLVVAGIPAAWAAANYPLVTTAMGFHRSRARSGFLRANFLDFLATAVGPDYSDASVASGFPA